MKLFNHNHRVIALIIAIGALPFLFFAPAHASEKGDLSQTSTEVSDKESGASKWLDDYHKPVGLTYNAKATLNAAYLWRGQYCGAANLQAAADVGYGGAYINMWWNIGTYNWRFDTFQPEVDFSLGFNRWGLNVYLLYVHHFDCGFFDFNNRFGSGNRLELNLRYTISSKLPLTIHWATRVAAADGYYADTIGSLQRAWSSYLELSYTHNFKYGISLYGGVGITPWKSCYTAYAHDFGVVNVDVRLRKDWSLSKHCGLMVQGQLCINPTLLAADLSSARWLPYEPAGQTVNANLSVGVYLK